MSNSFDQRNNELQKLITDWEQKLNSLPEEISSGRRNKQQRCIREIVGHMIDSATNNTHRIVHMHYQEMIMDFPKHFRLHLQEIDELIEPK